MRLFLFAVLLLAPVLAFAGTVSSIEIKGNERTDPNTIRTYMVLHEGDDATPAAMDASVHALFHSGLFRDVHVAENGGVLTVTVKENPIINRIAFEGNSELSEDKIKDEIRLAPRSIYTIAKVQDDMDRIYQLYRSKGYFAAKVEPQIIERDQNRVDLVFKITEGPDSGIRRIDFIGNKAFSRGTLTDQIFSAEQAWYNFLTNNDIYDPDRLNADQDKLRRYYNQNGYADFKVQSAIAEFAPDQRGFYLTFTVNEGPRYKFGHVTVESQKDGLDIKPLQELMKTEAGDWYNSDKIEETINAITDHVNRKNYAFLVVSPEIKRNEANHTIDIQYVLKDGPKIYVERIDIKGNLRTQDRVIRREFTLAEGDALNPTKLKQSEQNIKDLNYFKKVDIKQLDGSAPDRKIIEVNVEEQSTGDLSVGAGYSTQDGPLVNFGIKERNLLGRGQTLAFSAELSQRRNTGNLSFTEPYFMGRNVAATIDVFDTRTDNTSYSSYVEQQGGGGVRFGYHLSEYLTQQLGYRFTASRITGVAATASIYIQNQQGSRTVSMASHGIAYDRRDSKTDPTRGYITSLNTDFAGLGGSTRYIRNVLNATHYWSLSDNWVIQLLGEGGYIYGLSSQNLNVNDRFFLGGDNFRGFKYGGVGPRDVSTQDSLGGNEYLRGTVQLGFPLGLEDEGINGHAFSDMGTITKLGFSGPTVKDDQSLRLSAGFGVFWKSPFGPITIDIATPIIKKDYDQSEVFHVGFGTKF